MKYHGVSVYNQNKYKFTKPMVYTNNEWKTCECYIRLGNSWKRIGDANTQMLWMQDDNNDYVYVNGEPYLVREAFDDSVIILQDVYERDLLDSNDDTLTV